MGIRRRYITLASTILFVIIFVSSYFYSRFVKINGNVYEKYYEYVLLIVQIILMRVVYVSKNEGTKDIVTTMSVIITILYMILFFYEMLVS